MSPPFRALAAAGLAAALLAPAAALGLAGAASAAEEPPALAAAVAEGTLPALGQRLPDIPFVDPLDREWQNAGRYGGAIETNGPLSMDTVSFVTNTAGDDGGGIRHNAGTAETDPMARILQLAALTWRTNPFRIDLY